MVKSQHRRYDRGFVHRLLTFVWHGAAMISSSTLSAFSAGIKSIQSGGIQPTRVASPAQATTPVQKQLQALPSPLSPVRPSPRGSLLDLSV